MLRRLFSSQYFAIAYTVLAIALLTLNPFHFQAYDPAEWWVLRFWLSDVCQNILLFLPLGILLRHRFRLPYGLCLLWGFLLSFSIESAQLFIGDRTSNFIDLITNSTGSLGGAWLYQWGLEGDSKQDHALELGAPYRSPDTHFSLAVMLLPLCWVRTMTVEWQPHGTWLLLPSAIALLALLQASHRPQSDSQATQYTGLLLAIFPLTLHAPMLLAIIVGASILIHIFSLHRGISSQYLSLGAICLGFGLIARSNIIWLRRLSHHIGDTWYNLLWIEILLAFLVLMSVYSKGQSGRSKLPKS